MTRSPARWLAVLALGVAVAVAGYWLQFTTFMIYDDEGYVLTSLRNFAGHGGLYDEVYSQYGPFFYLLYDVLHRLLHFEFTNVTGRWITLVNWIGTSGFCALVVARTSRSAVAAALTLVLTFAYLWVMINEPIHPGGLIAILVAAGVWAGAELWHAGRGKTFAVTMGAFGSALVFTKVNVGVFFIAAVCVWLGLHATRPDAARRAAWIIAAAAVGLPLWLMKSLHDQQWIQVYGLVFAAGLLSTLLAARAAAQPLASVRTWLCFIAAGVLTAVVVCGAVLLRGTSVSELVNGVVISPLKHPGVYFFAMNWRAGTSALAILSVATTAWLAHTDRWREPKVAEAIAWARLLAIVTFLCTPLRIIPTSIAAWGMCYGITLAWVFAVPLRATDRTAAVRAWIAFMLTFEFLQGYPVAGSQINWGTYLWVPLAMLGTWDAIPHWKARLGRAQPWLSRAGLAAAGIIAVATAFEFCRIGWDRYGTSRPLELKGAETLRLPDDITSDLQIITRNLQAHGDLLFSLPGMFSSNIWTGLPTPTYANVTHWFSLLTPAQQQQIVDRLSSAPRAVVLVQPALVEYLMKHDFPITGLLREWLAKECHPAVRIGGYVIWVRNGRTIVPVSTGRVAKSGDALVLTLDALPREVARIDVCPLVGQRTATYSFDSSNTTVAIQPVSEGGAATGAMERVAFPFALRPPFAEVTLQCRQPLPNVKWRESLLLLRDKDGAIIDTVRFFE